MTFSANSTRLHEDLDRFLVEGPLLLKGAAPERGRTFLPLIKDLNWNVSVGKNSCEDRVTRMCTITCLNFLCPEEIGDLHGSEIQTYLFPFYGETVLEQEEKGKLLELAKQVQESGTGFLITFPVHRWSVELLALMSLPTVVQFFEWHGMESLHKKFPWEILNVSKLTPGMWETEFPEGKVAILQELWDLFVVHVTRLSPAFARIVEQSAEPMWTAADWMTFDTALCRTEVLKKNTKRCVPGTSPMTRVKNLLRIFLHLPMYEWNENSLFNWCADRALEIAATVVGLSMDAAWVLADRSCKCKILSEELAAKFSPDRTILDKCALEIASEAIQKTLVNMFLTSGAALHFGNWYSNKGGLLRTVERTHRRLGVYAIYTMMYNKGVRWVREELGDPPSAQRWIKNRAAGRQLARDIVDGEDPWEAFDKGPIPSRMSPTVAVEEKLLSPEHSRTSTLVDEAEELEVFVEDYRPIKPEIGIRQSIPLPNKEPVNHPRQQLQQQGKLFQNGPSRRSSVPDLRLLGLDVVNRTADRGHVENIALAILRINDSVETIAQTTAGKNFQEQWELVRTGDLEAGNILLLPHHSGRTGGIHWDTIETENSLSKWQVLGNRGEQMEIELVETWPRESRQWPPLHGRFVIFASAHSLFFIARGVSALNKAGRLPRRANYGLAFSQGASRKVTRDNVQREGLSVSSQEGSYSSHRSERSEGREHHKRKRGDEEGVYRQKRSTEDERERSRERRKNERERRARSATGTTSEGRGPARGKQVSTPDQAASRAYSERDQLIQDLSEQVQLKKIADLRAALAQTTICVPPIEAVAPSWGVLAALPVGSTEAELQSRLCAESTKEDANKTSGGEVIDTDGVKHDAIRHLPYHHEVRDVTAYRRCVESRDYWVRITGTHLPIFKIGDLLSNMKRTAKDSAPAIGYDTMFSAKALSAEPLRQVVLWQWMEDKELRLSDFSPTLRGGIEGIQDLRTALINLQRLWMLAYGGGWGNTLQPFISRMDHPYPFRNYKIAYVVGALEESLRKVGSYIRTAPPQQMGTPEAPEFYEELVRETFRKIEFTDAGYEAWGYEKIIQSNMELPERSLDRLFEDRLAMALRSTSGPPPGSSQGQGRGMEVPQGMTEVCGHDMRAHYGLKDVTGAFYGPCTKVPCPRRHYHQLEGKSKSWVKKGLTKLHTDSDMLHRMIDLDAHFAN